VRWPVLALAVLAGSVLGLGACGACSQRAPGDAAKAQCAGDPISAVGDGTYYDADGTGSCSFEASPGDRMVAALNGPDYAHAAWCGACVAVSGPAGEVVVRVVDQCPGCKHGDLDLSREAFARIAPLSAGRVRIAWHEVACPAAVIGAGPIAYHLQSGSNAFWVAIQVRNHRHAIERLEARGADGYRPIARADYNYFVAPGGLGPGPFALRVTDVRGQVLEDGAIALGDGELRAGAGQFPVCP
jgi:expansin (peptidoglycan-binding protein)